MTDDWLAQDGASPDRIMGAQMVLGMGGPFQAFDSLMVPLLFLFSGEMLLEVGGEQKCC